MRDQDRYDSLIQWAWENAAHAYQFDQSVDWRLVKCQIRAESGFRPEAVSPSGARGVLQIMPGTWGEGFEADAFNPEKNIKKGVDYLGRLWAMFKEEQGVEKWCYALSSFNAGPGNIIKSQAFLKARGKPTTQWRWIKEVLHHFTGNKNAQETTIYVDKIIRDYVRETGLSGFLDILSPALYDERL